MSALSLQLACSELTQYDNFRYCRRYNWQCIIDCRSLGSADRCNTLLSLMKSKPSPTDPYHYFTDQRIVANGFAIREYKGSYTYLIIVVYLSTLFVLMLMIIMIMPVTFSDNAELT